MIFTILALAFAPRSACFDKEDTIQLLSAYPTNMTIAVKERYADFYFPTFYQFEAERAPFGSGHNPHMEFSIHDPCGFPPLFITDFEPGFTVIMRFGSFYEIDDVNKHNPLHLTCEFQLEQVENSKDIKLHINNAGGACVESSTSSILDLNKDSPVHKRDRLHNFRYRQNFSYVPLDLRLPFRLTLKNSGFAFFSTAGQKYSYFSEFTLDAKFISFKGSATFFFPRGNTYNVREIGTPFAHLQSPEDQKWYVNSKLSDMFDISCSDAFCQCEVYDLPRNHTPIIRTEQNRFANLLPKHPFDMEGWELNNQVHRYAVNFSEHWMNISKEKWDPRSWQKFKYCSDGTRIKEDGSYQYYYRCWLTYDEDGYQALF